MTIVEMRDKRAKLWATMQGCLHTHRTEKARGSAPHRKAPERSQG